MNGIPRTELKPKYPNIGLYLYCYAQIGQKFLDFMSPNEPLALRKLGKEYTNDELTTALLTLAMNRDMVPICQAYGLNATPDRVTPATQQIRKLIAKP